MKRPLPALLFLGALMLAVSVIAACASDENDKQAVRDVVERFGAALNARDFDALAQLIVAEACGVDEVTAEALEASSSCGSPPTFEKFEVRSVVVVGDEATATVDVTVDGRSEQRGLSLVRIGERWLIRSGV